MITDWGIPGMYTPPPPAWIELIQRVYLVDKIKLLCVLASEVGLKHLQSHFPGIEVGTVRYSRCLFLFS